MVASKILTEENFVNNMIDRKLRERIKRPKKGISHTIQNNQFSSAINFLCICQGLEDMEKSNYLSNEHKY